jgi:DNA repair exonuclease SbcCD ATPase subunit
VEAQKEALASQDAADAQADEEANLKLDMDGHRKRQQACQTLRELAEDKPKAPKRPEVGGYEKSSELGDRLQVLQEDISRAQALVDSCSGDVAECPTCGTPTTDQRIQSQLSAAEKDLPAMKEERAQLHTYRRLMREYRDSKTEYDIAKVQHDERVTHWREKRDSLKKLDMVASEERRKELSLVSTMRDKCRNAVQKVELRLPPLREDKQKAISAHVAAKRTLAQLQETCRQLKTSSAVAEDAKSKLLDHDVAKETAAGLQASIKEITRNRGSLNERLERTQRAVAGSAKGRKWLDFLGAARNVLHRDRLPAEVHKSVLREMERGVNEDLEAFEAPFYVEGNEELSFTAFFQDGVVMPAGGLSGGEKVTLALPFRLQVNSLFAAQVGMLVLDEPTAGLDAANVEAVIQMFDQLRGMAKSRGFQIIVITHERELERAFDQVFRVGNSE